MNYSATYCALISKRLQNPLSKADCYCEKHHIIPKSEGGSNLNENLVNLTAREHFVAHLLLAHIYNDNKMWRALNRLIHGNNKNYTKVTSRLYTKIKTQFSQIMSKKQKDNKFFLGKHHSEESKKKMAKIKLGNTWNKGKVRSEEYKKKMSEAKKGSVPWNKGKTQSMIQKERCLLLKQA